MRKSPLVSGFLYLLLGTIFTFFAIDHVQNDGWGFFAYLFIILATFDFGSGFKMIAFHFKLKKSRIKK